MNPWVPFAENCPALVLEELCTRDKFVCGSRTPASKKMAHDPITANVLEKGYSLWPLVGLHLSKMNNLRQKNEK
jgi:hypothetical protein